jgi:transcriptional regulator with XRE-family HTH domain
VNSKDANFALNPVKKKAPKWFKAWRKGLKLTQKQAAYLLGLKSRMVQNYESGTHDIPLYIRLAMASLSNGVTDFEDNEFKRPGKSLALLASAGLAAAKDASKEKKARKKAKKAQADEARLASAADEETSGEAAQT